VQALLDLYGLADDIDPDRQYASNRAALAGLSAFEAVEMFFGLGSIVWFVGVGVALRRTSDVAVAS
jgi:hypothetical protein